MLVIQSLDRPVLFSLSAAVTLTSTPRTAAIAPVAEEGGEKDEGRSGARGRLGVGVVDAKAVVRACARECKRGVDKRVWMGCQRARLPPSTLTHPPNNRRHAVSDASVSQLQRAAAERGAIFPRWGWGSKG